MGSRLGAAQVLSDVHLDSENALQVLSKGGSLVPESYDSLELTYVASGNGVGEIETVTYKLSGSTIAVLTLAYNATDDLISVTRS